LAISTKPSTLPKTPITILPYHPWIEVYLTGARLMPTWRRKSSSSSKHDLHQGMCGKTRRRIHSTCALGWRVYAIPIVQRVVLPALIEGRRADV
jgi:hypothetical protein